MTVVPRLLKRYESIVDLAIKNRPGVTGYRLAASKTLDAAYAGATTFLTVDSGVVFSSPSVRRSRIYRVEDSNVGLTRLWLNMNDYANANIPGDSDVSFLRVQERLTDGSFVAAGPILVIPPWDFFETGRRNLVLVGTAPNVAGRGNNLPAQTEMRIFFPKFADEVTVYNEEALLSNTLYFSFGIGLNEMPVPPATSRTFAEAGANEILIRGEGGTAAFSLSAAIVNGIQA